jgi:hypothetical protein
VHGVVHAHTLSEVKWISSNRKDVSVFVDLSIQSHLSGGILIITAPFPKLLNPFGTKSQKARPRIGVKKTNNLDMYEILALKICCYI